MRLVKIHVLSATPAQGPNSVWSLTLHPQSGVWPVFVLREHWLAMVALVKVVNWCLDFFLKCMLNAISFLVTAKPQCESDFDCNFDQKCSQGNCVPACSLISCGLNAICLPKSHRGICECIPDHFGNPSIACNKGMFHYFLLENKLIILHGEN